MADVILDVDYDITKAEANARKLNAQFEKAKIKLEEQKQKTAETAEKLKQVTNELQKQKAILDNKEDITLKEAENYERIVSESKKLTKEYAKQNAQRKVDEANLNSIGQKIKGTQIKTKELNKGWKSFGRSTRETQSGLEKNLRRVKELVKSALIFSALTKVFTAIRENFGEMIKQDSGLSAMVESLKSNFLVLSAQLLEVIKPVLSWIIQGLTYLVGIVSSIISAISGKGIATAQKMAGAVKQTEKSTKGIKENAEKATASFDTLQTAISPKDEEKSAEQTFSNPTQTQQQIVLTGQLATMMEKLRIVIDNIKNIFIVLSPVLVWIWDHIVSPFLAFAGNLILDILISITGALLEFSEWCTDKREDVSLTTSIIIGFLSGLVFYFAVKKIVSIINAIKLAIANFGTAAGLAQLKIALAAVAFGTLAAGIIYTAANWNKMNGAQKVITILGALAAAATAAAIAIAIFHTAWSVGIAAAAIAGGLALLGLTFAFTKNKSSSKSSANSFAAQDFSQSPIPQLANGAVIPGGQPFIAMLGDQKAGQTNIEAPLDTIVEAVRIAIGQPNFTIEATGSMSQLIKLLNLKITQEQKRASVF